MIEIFAHPWWVNLTILIPFLLWYDFRSGLKLNKRQIISALIFGIAFGITEAIVVIYLRTIAQSEVQIQLLKLSDNITHLEMLRNVGTILMLMALAALGDSQRKNQWALFFLAFSSWDLVYYLGLKFLTNWPDSLLTKDVLLLVPVPWTSQVWFPVLICLLLITVILIRNERS